MRNESQLRRGAAVMPVAIEQEADALTITWSDNRKCRYAAADLRRQCPCAQCVNEWTGERTLRPEAVADVMTLVDTEIVGRYALSFKFGDGHETGIYSFRLLRELCENQA